MLFEECLKVNPNSHLIDNEEEIDPSLVQNVTSIGVCGATSTPQMVNGENIQTHSSINILVFNQKQSEEEDFRERQCVNILTVFFATKE